MHICPFLYCACLYNTSVAVANAPKGSLGGALQEAVEELRVLQVVASRGIGHGGDDRPQPRNTSIPCTCGHRVYRKYTDIMHTNTNIYIMHIYIHTYIHIYHTCTYIYIYMCAHLHVHQHIHLHILEHVRVHACKHMCITVYLYMTHASVVSISICVCMFTRDRYVVSTNICIRFRLLQYR